MSSSMWSLSQVCSRYHYEGPQTKPPSSLGWSARSLRPWCSFTLIWLEMLMRVRMRTQARCPCGWFTSTDSLLLLVVVGFTAVGASSSSFFSSSLSLSYYLCDCFNSSDDNDAKTTRHVVVVHCHCHRHQFVRLELLVCVHPSARGSRAFSPEIVRNVGKSEEVV